MEPKFISLSSDTTIKYLWKKETTRLWLNEIILYKTGINLLDLNMIDNELNSGSKVKDYRLDLVFNNEHDNVIIEVNNRYSLSSEIKGRRYLFRKAGNSFDSGEKYVENNTTLIMLNNYYKKGFEECEMATYTLSSKELNDTLNDIKIIEIFLPKYYDMCYHDSNKINKRLALFNAKSYDEMRSLASPEDLYIIEELERLGMNSKFVDEYDAELVNDTLMESLREEGKKEGKEEGKKEGRSAEKIEIARNMLKDAVDKLIISKYTNLTIDEIDSIK